MNNTIVLVEDEAKIAKIICAYLEKEGYKVEWYEDGLAGWRALDKTEPILVVLDLMLPGLSGKEICSNLRNKGSKVPIVMLTAMGGESERINGLEIGADDYLVKPFSLRELVARIKAILRRSGTANESAVLANKLAFRSRAKTLELDLSRQKVKVNGEEKELTTTEFKVLAILAQNPERPFNREELIFKLQGYDYEGFDRSIDAHIKNIRRKLGLEPNQFIVTIYRTGYKFSGGVQEC